MSVLLFWCKLKDKCVQSDCFTAKSCYLSGKAVELDSSLDCIPWTWDVSVNHLLGLVFFFFLICNMRKLRTSFKFPLSLKRHLSWFETSNIPVAWKATSFLQYTILSVMVLPPCPGWFQGWFLLQKGAEMTIGFDSKSHELKRNLETTISFPTCNRQRHWGTLINSSSGSVVEWSPGFQGLQTPTHSSFYFIGGYFPSSWVI